MNFGEACGVKNARREQERRNSRTLAAALTRSGSAGEME
jgi:hypothetical protein